MQKRSVHKGDIVLVEFPYTDFSGVKRRPALVVGVSEEHAVVLFVTSQKTGPARWLVPVAPTKQNGLATPSYLRCDKLLSVDFKVLEGGIGVLETKKLSAVNNKLKTLFRV